MQEEKETSTSVDTEFEIKNMREFLMENQDIKLENLPTYEDLIKPSIETQTQVKDMKEVNSLPFFETKPLIKQQPQTNNIHKKRFKIAVSCFAIVGVLLASLVCVNGISLAIMSDKVKDNQKEITTLTQEVAELEGEYDTLTNTQGEKVKYKLALPRNYPKDTKDLTWFDKLSIFLMKLFG